MGVTEQSQLASGPVTSSRCHGGNRNECWLLIGHGDQWDAGIDTTPDTAVSLSATGRDGRNQSFFDSI